jgi:hypothetical protein
MHTCTVAHEREGFKGSQIIILIIGHWKKSVTERKMNKSEGSFQKLLEIHE